MNETAMSVFTEPEFAYGACGEAHLIADDVFDLAMFQSLLGEQPQP